MSVPLSFAEEMANQVAFEYAKLKEAGVGRIDYSQLLTNILRENGVRGPTEMTKFRAEVAKIGARRRTQRANQQQNLRF